MKKIILFAAAAMMAAVVSAQTVSTSSITFANCTTEYVNNYINIGELEVPFTYKGQTFTEADFTNNNNTQVVVFDSLNDRGCDAVITTTITRIPGVLVAKLFSVNSTKKVLFSKGNLRSVGSTVSFQDYQYMSYLNTNNRTSGGTFDVFLWGCSGYSTYYMYNTSSNNQYKNGNIQGGNNDWAWYPNISNGGGKNIWYTLKNTEWEYLLKTRTNAAELRMLATIAGGYQGMILLPDDWQNTTGVTLTATIVDYTTNTLTTAEWNLLQNAGAIFLPVTGIFNSSWQSNCANRGCYWGSGDHCYGLDFSENNVKPNSSMSGWAVGVRAVRDLPTPIQQ